MPRSLRIQAPGVIYHVGSRGVDKQPIYGVVRWDREMFLTLVEYVVLLYGWRLHAYCLMGNHFHLVVETPNANLAAGMQYLKGVYARWFNGQRGRVGTLFERRYWDRVATTEAYVLELSRYVALNPVRVGWTRAPEEWLWSSYPAMIGLEPTPRFLFTADVLGWFGDGELARSRYRSFVEDGIGVLGRPQPAGPVYGATGR